MVDPIYVCEVRYRNTYRRLSNGFNPDISLLLAKKGKGLFKNETYVLKHILLQWTKHMY